MIEKLRMEGKTALVVGGGGHLGRAVAEGLAELGASVALADRAPGLDRLASELASQRMVRVTAHLVDLEHLDADGLMSDVAEAHDRGVDVLVHCAALVGATPLPGWATDFHEQSAETWRRALEVNLTSAFLLLQSFSTRLAAGSSGSVVLVGSVYGHVGPDLRLYQGTSMGNPAAYAASKGGLSQLARWAATALAPRIRVNTVSPGGIARSQPERFTQAYQSRTPLGRLATEDEVASVICFLCSPGADYVTGQDLLVDGGYTTW